MLILEIYTVGMVIAFILAIILFINEPESNELQSEMVAPIALLSWVSVILIIWKYFIKKH